MKEAALRSQPLRVVTVQPVVEPARVAAQEAIDKVLAGLRGPRPESVTVEAVSGIPAEVLVMAGADADLIVLGSRGAGGFARLALGSVSSQVAHHAPCPVVIVPGGEKN